MPLELGELRLYSVDKLSEQLKISKDTVRNYLKEGKLRGKKLGGIPLRRR